MFNRGHFGTGQEVSPGLTPQAKLLLLKIPPQIIQEGYNSQEDQQRQKTPPLYYLPIYQVPQEAMEGQREMIW